MAEKRKPAWDPRTDPGYQKVAEDIRDIVRRWLRKHQEISHYRLGHLAGVSPQTVTRLVETDVSKQSMAPQLRTLFLVLVAVGSELRVQPSKEAKEWGAKHPRKLVPRRGNTDYDLFLGEVCQAIWGWAGYHLHSERRIARDANMHAGTVVKLLWGPDATKSPRLSTVRRLFIVAHASLWVKEVGHDVRQLGAARRKYPRRKR